MKRTRILIPTLCLLFVTVLLQAQDAIGVRLGYRGATISAPAFIDGTVFDVEMAHGLEAGIFAEWQINDRFSFQPELAFTQKGFAAAQGLDVDILNVPIPIGVKAVSKINYLEVPLLAKYYLSQGSTKAYVLAGPTFSYATNAKLTTKADLLIEIPLSKTNIDLDNIGYERFEVGAQLGAGVLVPMGSSQFFLDARYTRGFTDTFRFLNTQNQGIAINAGIRVPLGGSNNYPLRP